MDYQIIQINENTWRIEEQGVRFFLLTGTKEALLIDSGMMVKNAKEIAESLTDLPLKLLNTHADMDHIAGNTAFDTFYMHPAEYTNYHKTQKRPGKMMPVWDGDIIDLGNRQLEVITLPGHTPGSIALLDIERRVLISGDPIQDGRIFMFGPQRDMLANYYSMKKISGYMDRFDTIYPSHGSFPLSSDIILKLIDGIEKMMRGEIEAKEGMFKNMPLKIYDIETAVFLCDKDFSF